MGVEQATVAAMVLLALTRVIEGMIWEDDRRAVFMVASNSIVLIAYLVCAIFACK